MKAGHRNVPDIAFVADPATGTAFYYAGAWRGPVGGTSWGSPIYSALQTEVDQRHGERFGHANPAIYAAAAKYTSAILHDVTSGCNGAYCAHASVRSTATRSPATSDTSVSGGRAVRSSSACDSAGTSCESSAKLADNRRLIAAPRTVPQ
jgi:subtilase family serine protease